MNQQQTQPGMFSTFAHATVGLLNSVVIATTVINRGVNAVDNVVQVAERTAITFNVKHKLTSTAEIAVLAKELELIDKDDLAKAQAYFNNV